MGRVDEGGRAIAGLLGYNPGPGIYSRLERAVEGMPANVRVQELPGLLKRYKEGVPGWELKATDLDSTIAGRDVVPRDELLAAVRARSPVHTHGEVILGGRPQMWMDKSEGSWSPDYQFPYTGEVSRLGMGVSHGEPRYREYGQGGEDYAELLLRQPGETLPDYGSHWTGDTKNAVAHARFDTHGDALRINELQSDLGIHNRKVREAAENYKGPPPQLPSEPDSHYLDRVQEQGYVMQIGDDGEWQWVNDPKKQGLPFPLEDAWAEILIKRLALEAARKGHRAIEVASPRAIADKVGGNIDNYEHFYGKVVPGALERLGRKMGGLTPDTGVANTPTINTSDALSSAINDARTSAADAIWRLRRRAPGMGPDLLQDEYDDIANKMHMLLREGHSLDSLDGILSEHYDSAYNAAVRSLTQGNMPVGQARKAAGMAMGDLIERAKAQAALSHRRSVEVLDSPPSQPPVRRYIMSDAMRRRLIESGVGAAVLAPLLMQGEE